MDNNTHFVQYKIFSPFHKLRAFTTTKQSLNIGCVRFSDEPENIVKLAQILHVDAENLVFPKQTHSNCVFEVEGVPQQEINETDALVSNKTGIYLCVQTADCVPILLYDPVKNVISAVHAGWRGTVGKIVELAVQRMVVNYGSLPENILAAVGPSVSPEIYEVGEEVVLAVKQVIPNFRHTLHKNDAGNFHFNLWEANRQLLLRAGLKSENIEVLGECSFLTTEKFYSARRDGIDTGRMVSGIMLEF